MQEKKAESATKTASSPSPRSLLQRPKTANTFEQWKKEMQKSPRQSLRLQRPATSLAILKLKDAKKYIPTTFLKIPLRRIKDPIEYEVPKPAKKPPKVKKPRIKSPNVLEVGRTRDRSVKLDLEFTARNTGPAKIAQRPRPAALGVPKPEPKEETNSRELIEEDETEFREDDALEKRQGGAEQDHAEQEVVFCKRRQQIQTIPKLSLRMQDCLSLVDLMKYTRMRLEMQMVTT
jgi:hypothetical protein